MRQQVASGKISGRDYLMGTGRIDAGIGTGDTAIHGSRGDIVGYTAPGGGALGGGSLVGGEAQFTPEFKWRGAFGTPSGLTIPPASIEPSGTPAEARFARTALNTPAPSAFAY